MTAVDLGAIYTSNHVGAVLRCTEHPDWEVDVDGTELPWVVRRAEDHVRDEHVQEER